MSKINIVQISAALGFPVTATFITDVLGVPPDQSLSVKRALFWPREQYGMIHGRLQNHLNSRIGIDPSTFTPERPRGEAAAAPAPAAAPAEPEGFGFEEPAPAAEPEGFGFDDASAETEGFF